MEAQHLKGKVVEGMVDACRGEAGMDLEAPCLEVEGKEGLVAQGSQEVVTHQEEYWEKYQHICSGMNKECVLTEASFQAPGTVA